jgi:GTPase involved in cell partitioning and DNA repair
LNVQPLLSRIGRAGVHLAVGLMYVSIPSIGRLGLPATGLACFVADVAGCRPALMMFLIVVGILFQ